MNAAQATFFGLMVFNAVLTLTAVALLVVKVVIEYRTYRSSAEMLRVTKELLTVNQTFSERARREIGGAIEETKAVAGEAKQAANTLQRVVSDTTSGSGVNLGGGK